MGLISRVSSRTYRKTQLRTCLPTQERPEKCEAKSATVTDELVNTESIQVDEVWLVVNIITESTSTNCGPSLAKTSERNTPTTNPKPQSLTAPPTTSTKSLLKVNCQINQSSSKPDSSANKPKKRSR